MTQTLKLKLPLSLLSFFRDIKLAHSIFALPFVLTTLVLIDFDGSPLRFFFIIVCMISARSFAMGMNRYLDRHWDALNPRTKQRLIPLGVLSANKGLFWSLIFGFIFICASFQLSSTAGYLSPFLLLILGLYPLMKQFSWLTHWYLGACLGLSPIAASIALTGKADFSILLLGSAIMMWTAGFDILYALQDYAFDREFHLKSAPTQFQVKGSLFISRLCFLFMIGILLSIGVIRHLGAVYYVGVVLIAAILFWEQWIVRSSNEESVSSKINLAFFNANACVGIFYYMFTHLDAMIRL